MLRNDVSDALKNPDSNLVEIAHDWRHILFPDVSDKQFADLYAQTVVFGLLLARVEGADPLDIEKAIKTLYSNFNLLSRALLLLTDTMPEQKLIPLSTYYFG